MATTDYCYPWREWHKGWSREGQLGRGGGRVGEGGVGGGAEDKERQRGHKEKEGAKEEVE